MVNQKTGDVRRSGLRGRRVVQAEQTRRDILTAARHRFARDGYAATSLKEIAADAGVSVQTVYDSVGPKPELIRGLNDLVDEEAQVGEIVGAFAGSDDPFLVVSIPARVTRRLVDRCGDVLRACLAGAQAEPGLADVAVEGGRRHRAGAAMIAGRLAELGVLRPGLDAADATKSIAAIADFRLALVLMDDHGLDLDQIQAWIVDTTARAVFASVPEHPDGR